MKVWIFGYSGKTLNDIWAVYDSLEKAIEARDRFIGNKTGSAMAFEFPWIVEMEVL